MSQNFEHKIIKCIIDTLIFLEFTSDELIDQDSSIALMEQISNELNSLSEMDKQKFIHKIMCIIDQYPPDQQRFIKNLPVEFFGWS